MLLTLRIENLAIIESACVTFGPGLNVLSGETGTGKSVLLQGLSLILGAKGGTHLVRTGSPGAQVSASFSVGDNLALQRRLRELDLPLSDTLEIRRTLPPQGSGRSYVNDRAVKRTDLQSLGSVLVEFSGQHEQRLLMDCEHHRMLLDRHGRCAPELDRVSGAHKALAEARRGLRRLKRDADRVEEQQEYLRFQLQELKELSPEDGEFTGMEQALLGLRHAEDLRSGARNAERELYSAEGSALDRLTRAESALRGISAFDSRFGAQADRLAEVLYLVEDVAQELQVSMRQLQSNPRSLDELERRRRLYVRLARKHGCDPNELHLTVDRLELELEGLGNLDQRMDAAAKVVEDARVRAMEHADQLSAARQRAALRLDEAMAKELGSLAMKQARFCTALVPATEGERLPDGRCLGPLGAEDVVFQLSANPGEEPRAVAKVASGGELSRVLLGLKIALRGGEGPRSWVFDEIDAGISGQAAETVGAKLRELSGMGQLLCITHLPQIALLADSHLRISKQVKSGRTRTQIENLDLDGRVEEVARLVGGAALTDGSRSYARELLAAYDQVA
ncbi:MAG: DNA repair protein RecN (Recombination protein N) [Cognaticolwellia sp.]|jgi:DNA repair protein RecN (Recombination protein N)